jgi:hypothetical protein
MTFGNQEGKPFPPTSTLDAKPLLPPSEAAEIPILRLLLIARDAAKALSVSERTLWGLTHPRGPIPVVKFGRAVRYDARDLAAFIDRAKEGGR